MAITGTAPERRNDLDWMRILAVLLLIPFHSARIFDVFEPFYVKNADLSPWLSGTIVGFLSTWQMQLLFLIAGASTWYALGHRSGGQYMGERLRRLMIPFVFGTLVIVPPQMYLALLFRSSTNASYLEYYPRFFQLRPFDIPDYTGIGFSWAHLWFILDLFVISLIALPLLLKLRSGSGRGILSWWGRFTDRGRAIFLLAIPFLLVGDLPEVDGKPFFTYLLVFIYGFVLMSDGGFQRALERNKEAALVLGIATMSVIYGVYLSGTQFADNSIEDVSLFIVRNCNLWFWLVALLGFGQKYLNADNGVLRYAREAAYPFYVLHQTVIVWIGFYVVQWNADALLKFLVIAAGSLIATVGIYDLLVRRTNMTRFLFGMKPRARITAPQIASPSS